MNNLHVLVMTLAIGVPSMLVGFFLGRYVEQGKK